MATVGSYGGGGSYERGTPVRIDSKFIRDFKFLRPFFIFIFWETPDLSFGVYQGWSIGLSPIP